MNTTWLLQDKNHACLSSHPNTEGAKLSALRHIQNGQTVIWEDRKLPVDVAALIGVVDGKDRFVICRQ